VANETHIHEKLSLMMIFAAMCRAGSEAAIAHATTNEDGNLMPSNLYTSATKYYHAELHDRMVDILHDIAGTGVVNAPTMADYDNPELRSGIDALFDRADFSAEDRLKLMHFLRDTTADSYGGWSSVTGKQAGGGQYAQRLVVQRNFDLEHAKDLAKRVVGIGGYEPEHTFLEDRLLRSTGRHRSFIFWMGEVEHGLCPLEAPCLLAINTANRFATDASPTWRAS
jgi:4-hydroxybutyryl-CoA dehydratase/vinylacetyl-CoA-Delta-isomerase